jgi:branched-chain amino acid transport system permease protein
MGYYLFAISTNPVAASTIGINVAFYKLVAQAVSAFFMAMGGGFYAMLIMFIDPPSVFGFDLSLQVLLFAIIGGTGTLWGPVLGALLLVPLNQFLRTSLGASIAPLSIIIYGLLLVIFIMFIPDGIVGLFGRLFNRLKTGKSAASAVKGG